MNDIARFDPSSGPTSRRQLQNHSNKGAYAHLKQTKGQPARQRFDKVLHRTVQERPEPAKPDQPAFEKSTVRSNKERADFSPRAAEATKTSSNEKYTEPRTEQKSHGQREARATEKHARRQAQAPAPSQETNDSRQTTDAASRHEETEKPVNPDEEKGRDGNQEHDGEQSNGRDEEGSSPVPTDPNDRQSAATDPTDQAEAIAMALHRASSASAPGRSNEVTAATASQGSKETRSKRNDAAAQKTRIAMDLDDAQTLKRAADEATNEEDQSQSDVEDDSAQSSEGHTTAPARMKLNDSSWTAVRPFTSALQAVDENTKSASPTARTSSSSTTAETQAEVARARRQEAAMRAVNRMTLSRSARADIELPELGKLSIEARSIGGEIDIDLSSRDSSLLSVLQSASAAMESDLRKSSIELRNINFREEADAADEERQMKERRTQSEDEDENANPNDGNRQTDSRESTSGESSVRIVL